MTTTILPPIDPDAAPVAPLQRLILELRRQLETKKDVVADTRRVSFIAGVEHEGRVLPETLTIDMPDGAQGFDVTRHAHGQIADVIGVQQKTYDRLLGNHPDLFEHLVNGLLSREPSKRLLRLLDGRVRAVLSDRYRPRDNWDLMEHLMPVLAPYNLSFKQCELTEKRLYIKTFDPATEVQVKGAAVGDVIRGGVIISNSEVGAGSLYVYPYTDRLWCTNGAVHTDFGQRRVHLGKQIESGEEAYEFYSDETMRLDDAAFFAKCADTVKGCLDRQVFEAIAAQMGDLAAIRVDGSPVDAVKVIAKQKNFTGDEEASILTHLIEGGDLSAWGYVNAITATARDLPDIDRQTELEVLAGRMISDPTWAAVA